MALSDSSYDLRLMALGVLYVNLGLAAPSFPTTSRAHPSYNVLVDLIPPVGLLDATHKVFFPFKVRWDMWQKVVVPVFEEADVLVKTSGRTSLRNQGAREWLLVGDLEPLLLEIEEALRVQARAVGYLPAASERVPEEEGVGEPVVAPGTNDGSTYTRFD